MPEGASPIRLVALDVDGTLVASAAERSAPPRTRAVIRAVRATGVEVVLVTGRMPAAALPLAVDLGLTAPLIAHHGAVTVALDGAIEEHMTLEPALARAALAWAASNGLRAHLNRLDALIMADDDPRIGLFERIIGVPAERAADLRTHVTPPVTKAMIGTPDGAELPRGTFVAAVRALGDRARITTSGPRFVEALAPSVSKAAAVRSLAARLGVGMDEVLAIGDDWSDLELLAEVGHPVAMPHAPSEVLARAAHIAPPLGEEGAATMLERLVL